MKVFRISAHGYTTNIYALDRQNARTKLINRLNKDTHGMLATDADLTILSEQEVIPCYLNIYNN